ncbi:MAG: PrsW family intramembrane metalloprotease [Spirochaetales bacterium]|nr:PrsW family intramembrane metalloprotease [Spirochaetales bacterium]
MWFLAINTALALIPALFLVSFFYRRDKQKPEPKALIWKTFVIGFFSVLPAIVLELVLNRVSVLSDGLGGAAIDAFLVAGLVEESIKLAVIMIFIFKRDEFDEVHDGIVYMITASMGFAFFENIMYSFGSSAIILIRGVTAVPLHAIASGIMGYYIGKTKCGDKNYIAKGLLLAVLIHGTYDFFLFTGGAFIFLVLPLLIISGFLLFMLSRRALKEDLYAGRS